MSFFIATPRILELSKPRNKTSLKLYRKKKFNYVTCSKRIEYLAKPRIHCQKVKIESSKRKSLSSQISKYVCHFWHFVFKFEKNYLIQMINYL